MAYSLVDILGKLRAMEEYALDLYGDIIKNSEKDLRASTVAKVLRREEINIVKYYDKLIDEAKKQIESEIAIDFDIYDKVYSLITEFRKRMYTPNVSSVSSIVSFSYKYEKASIALLLDIRGRMIREGDESSDYKNLTFTRLIYQRQRHIDAIAKYCRSC